MPHATASDGTRIAYALAGPRDAEPLLMIHGLGADTRGWVMQRRVLASRFRLVLVDNRGDGRGPLLPQHAHQSQLAVSQCPRWFACHVSRPGSSRFSEKIKTTGNVRRRIRIVN